MDEGRMEEEGLEVKEEEEGGQYEGAQGGGGGSGVHWGEEGRDWQMKGNFRVSVV